MAHTFLISGVHGSGKENLAARMIQLVNGGAKSGGCDLFGVNGAMNGVRSLRFTEISLTFPL
jgi:hypothetical protein